MRRTSPSSRLRFACPLLIMLLLLAAGDYRAVSPVVSRGVQSVGECSDSPKDCKTPVKYLGESKGCACFACEYGKRTQKILCTRNEADKRTLKLLLPRTSSGTN